MRNNLFLENIKFYHKIFRKAFIVNKMQLIIINFKFICL